MENLEQELTTLIENVRHLGIIVSDFHPETGQPALNQKVNQIVNSLCNINKFKSSVANIQVPTEVFEYIDSGKNPQFYTKDYMEKALTKNEEVKGKIETYSKFKKTLIDELCKVFPTEMNNYNTLRPSSNNSTTNEQ